jgi:hypothetical protein
MSHVLYRFSAAVCLIRLATGPAGPEDCFEMVSRSKSTSVMLAMLIACQSQEGSSSPAEVYGGAHFEQRALLGLEERTRERTNLARVMRTLQPRSMTATTDLPLLVPCVICSFSERQSPAATPAIYKQSIFVFSAPLSLTCYSSMAANIKCQKDNEHNATNGVPTLINIQAACRQLVLKTHE